MLRSRRSWTSWPISTVGIAIMPASAAAGGSEAPAAEEAASHRLQIWPGAGRGVAVLLGGSGRPARKRLAPGLPQLVASLRRHGELEISDADAGLVIACPRPLDWRLAADRQVQLKGRGLTKPGSLLKSQIPMRTWSGLG